MMQKYYDFLISTTLFNERPFFFNKTAISRYGEEMWER